MPKLIQDIGVEIRKERRAAGTYVCYRFYRWHTRIVKFKPGTVHFRTSMHGYTHFQRQAVHYLPAMAQIQIQVLEIIQMYLVEIKDTVGNSFQVIQHITTINPVTITKFQMKCRTLTRPIIKIRLHPPVKFFLFKIITYPGNDSQQAVALEYTVVLEFLPIRNSMFAAITQKKRINQRRTAYTSQFIKVYRVATNQSIPNLSPEFQILIDRLLFPDECIPTQEKILIQCFLVQGQRNGT